MIQFYSPDIASTLTLPESDSGHCTRVLRLREGDEIFVVDGAGKRYRCVITLAHHKRTTVEIVGVEELPKSWKGEITIAVAPPKNIDRLEWFVEKAVEMGVDRIVPVRCARSERKDVRIDRIEKIIVSAMKQSLKGIMPQLSPVTPIADFMKDAGGEKFVGYCDSNTERRDFARVCPADSDVTVLIGPEGDFTPEEIEMALRSGFVPVTFGDERLRTETAALFAVATIHVIDQLKTPPSP